MMRTVFFVAVLLLAVVSSLCARTWPVPSAECPTIQAGVDSAWAGDTVLVVRGTYQDCTHFDPDGWPNCVIMKSGICLRSETGHPDCVVIDAGRAGRCVYCLDIAGDTMIHGFTFTGGYASGGGDAHCGGAMFCKSSWATIRSCRFVDNLGEWRGGGLYWCGPSSPTLEDCAFEENISQWGGGVHFESCFPTMVACRFRQNWARDGGGGIFFNNCQAVLDDCLLIDNVADSPFGDWGDGGGIYCWNASSPVLTRTAVSGNAAAEKGGGLYCTDACSPTLRNCTFAANRALRGSGLCFHGNSSPVFERTIIAYGHLGEGVLCGGGIGATADCCNIYGNVGGDWVGCLADQYGVNGNFSACPSFCNAFAEPFDLHLCDESPCAPGNHPDGYDCGLIGAWPVGCSCGPSRREGTTWGAIKAMYR